MSADNDHFLQQLLATFRAEADDHLQVLSSGLLELEKGSAPDRRAAIVETIFREAHSLKGAARAVNRMEIGSLCQSLESVFAAWKQHGAIAAAAAFDVLHRALDAVRARVAAAETQPADSPADIARLKTELSALESAATAPPPPRPAAPTEFAPRPKTEPAATRAPAEVHITREKPGLPETLRIATAKLDTFLLQAEELVAFKLAEHQRAADLREIELTLDAWAKEWAKIRPEVRSAERVLDGKAGEGARALDAAATEKLLEFLHWNWSHVKGLEGRLLALSKSAQRDRHAVATMVDTLLEDAKKLLMLPFSTLLDAFPKLVRDISREQGKEIELVVRGGQVEIDKRILDEMKDPLIHLLRNAVDHGIEQPGDRARRGKPARGVAAVAVSQVDGNTVEILVSDDGEGIDLDHVKDAAVHHGILAPERAPELSPIEAVSLIFESGVSTSPRLTEISGRGLGLAIVREKVEKLGGRILVDTQPRVGTSFRVLLPLTLATFRGVLIRAGGGTFVIPTANLERATRVAPAEVKTVEGRDTLALGGRVVSLVRLDETLELPASEADRKGGDRAQVVVLGAADRRVAFRVDEIVNEQEVLVKPLGWPLLRVRNVAGATVLGSGRVVPILNVADLLKSALRAGPRRLAAAKPAAPRKRSILVVEDSITARTLLKNILEAAGYAVRTAVDGVDACSLLQTRDFDAVVSDIQMPRMDGFELTARIRAGKRTAELPVVLVTALASREDRERGAEAGANAYIVKSSFDQGNLLETVRRLL